jgi:hypothetical protein
MSKVVVVGGLLALSIAANAYLLLTRDREAPKPTAAPARTTVDKTTVLPSRATAPALPDEQPSTTLPEYAKLTRAELEKRLAASEARLAKLLPVQDRFELAERSSESEARVKPFLDKVFKVDGKTQKPAYEVECHARICKLTVDETIAGEDWMQPLQSDSDGRGMFAGFAFGPDGTFMELQEAARAAGMQAAIKIVMSLYESKAVADCKKQHTTPGNVAFAITIDARSHRFVAEASGSLANQALGVCLRRIVDDALAAVTLPPDAVLSEPAPFAVQVP